MWLNEGGSTHFVGTVAELPEMARQGWVPLMYAARDEERNQAFVLREYLAFAGEAGCAVKSWRQAFLENMSPDAGARREGQD